MPVCKCFQHLPDVRHSFFLITKFIDKICASHLSLLQRHYILSWAKTIGSSSLKTAYGLRFQDISYVVIKYQTRGLAGEPFFFRKYWLCIHKKLLLLHRESKTGCSAVRLAHLLWEQGVEGSNPFTPTFTRDDHSTRWPSFF